MIEKIKDYFCLYNGTYNEIREERRVELKTVDFKNDIINSCKTDIEVLRATSGIIGLLLSSNQYVAVRF
jgi:hypothetical protein